MYTVWHSHISGLGLQRRRWQDVLGRQTAEGQVPALSESLHPFLCRSAAGRTPRGSASPRAADVIYGQGAPLFPDELRWRRDALRLVLLLNPSEQTCILHQSLCLGPTLFAGCLHSSRATGQVCLQKSSGSGSQSHARKWPHSHS